MKLALFSLLAAITIASSAIANEDQVKVDFSNLIIFSEIKPPKLPLKTSNDALDFILSDTTVRNTIFKAKEEGYSEWEATAEKIAEADGLWAVRITSMSALPPYSCYFRFDSLGNDHREKPWLGCKYNK